MYNKPGVARGMDWCRGRGKKSSTASFNPLPFSPCIHVLTLASSSCLCCATSTQFTLPAVYCSRAWVQYQWLLCIHVCAVLHWQHWRLPHWKQSDYYHFEKWKHEDSPKKHMTSQHKYRCYKLYIGHPHLPSVLKWIFHKFKLSHPHHSTCQRLSEQGQWREKRHPPLVYSELPP